MSEAAPSVIALLLPDEDFEKSVTEVVRYLNALPGNVAVVRQLPTDHALYERALDEVVRTHEELRLVDRDGAGLADEDGDVWRLRLLQLLTN